MNSNTLNLEIKVDAASGEAQIRTVGTALKSAAQKGTTGFTKTKKTLGDFNKQMTVTSSLATKVKGLFAGITIAWVAKEALAVADAYTMLDSRLKLVTDSEEELTSVQQELYDLSLRTRTQHSATVELYARMARAAENLGASENQLLVVTEAINQSMVVSGATATEASAAMIQLAQGIASGRLQGEELRSVLEQTPRLASAIADGMGVEVGALRDLAAEGELTAETVINALIDQADAIQVEFDQMEMTVEQVWTNLKTVLASVVDDSNDAADGTGQIADAIQELSATIDAHRDDLVAVFSAMIEGVTFTINAVGELDEFVGWATGNMMIGVDHLVESWEVGGLSIKNAIFIAMDQILEKEADTLDKVVEMLAKIPLIGDDIEAAGSSATDMLRNWSTATEEYGEQLDDIRTNHEVVRESYRETMDEMVNGTDEVTTAVKTLNTEVTKLAPTTETAVTYSTAQLKAFAEAGEALGDDMWIPFNDGLDEARLRAIQNIGEMEEALEDLDAVVSDDSFFAIADTIEAELDESQQRLDDFYSTFQSAFSSAFSSYLVEQFGGISGEWGALWDAMLAKMGEVVAEMAVTWVASEVSNMFEGWDIFHSGIWNLADDEVPSILQSGEMVIPAEHAEEIRGNLSEFDGSFDSLVDATGQYSAGDWSGTFADNLQDSYSSDIIGLVTGALLGGDIGSLLSDLVSPENALTNSTTALTETGITAMNLTGAWSDIGSFLGKGLTTMALGGSNAGVFAGGLGSFLGAYVGNMIGDLLDDREFESLRDALEDGLIDQEEYERYVWDAMEMAGGLTTGDSNLAGFFEAVSNTISGIKEAISSVITSLTSSATTDSYDDLYDLDSTENEDKYDSTGWSTTGEYDDGDPSDYGDSDYGDSDYGDDTDDYGYSTGGVVDKLFVPAGDDGLGGMKFGEGVVDLDTMDKLSTFLSSDTDSSSATGEVSQEVLAALVVIATNTQQTYKALKRIEKNGIPEAVS